VSAPVTIAVVSWNTRDLLAACLRSIGPERRAGTADVVVVDNASVDGSAALVRDEFPWVTLIASDDNLGFGPAVNLAAGAAGGDWIGIANADTALHPGALAALIDAGRRDPRAGIVAPRLVLPDGSTQHSAHAFPTILNTVVRNAPLDRALGDRLCVAGHWRDDRRRRVDWAHGAFLLARRTAWDAVGGFDPDQWMYAEDLDIAWRMRRAGWFTRYEPTARVDHAESAATAKAWGDDRRWRETRAAYAWMARRRGPLPARAVAAVNTAGAGARAAAFATRAAVSRAPTVAAERDRWRWHMRLHRVGLRPGAADTAPARGATR
jgi:N-acetylglucosaminyl-diphospho-decaprenol L-rhamnosyltransferase